MLRKSMAIALFAGCFALVNTAQAMDLSQSMVSKTQSAGLAIFNRIVEQSKKDTSKTLMQHIVTDAKTDEALWEPLAAYGIEQNLIGPADLIFVIKEFSQPYIISKPLASKLFEEIIIDQLRKAHKRAKMAELLTRVAIEKPGSWSLWSGQGPKEERNVLAECIENSYLEAFGAMINVWPSDLDHLHMLQSVSINEPELDLASSGLVIKAYTYKPKESFTLVQWLMRNDGTEHTYMAGSWRRVEYTKAAQHLLEYVRSRKSAEIKGDMLGMAALLERQKELPELFSFHNFISRVSDISGINWSAVPLDQQQVIKDKLPKK